MEGGIKTKGYSNASHQMSSQWNSFEKKGNNLVHMVSLLGGINTDFIFTSYVVKIEVPIVAVHGIAVNTSGRHN